MVNDRIIAFASEVLSLPLVNPILSCYQGRDHVAKCISTAPSDADFRHSPGVQLNLNGIFEEVVGDRLVLLSDGVDDNTNHVDGHLEFGGKLYWLSTEITEPNQIEKFMLNNIEWINPICAVVGSESASEGLTCEAVKGFIIRAYDDDGFILLLIRRGDVGSAL